MKSIFKFFRSLEYNVVSSEFSPAKEALHFLFQLAVIALIFGSFCFIIIINL